ncbi:MAG: MotA/TolQ/ExbB proton channel family protein [Victivallales bacterium]|nr:MotA/TolQ/ExbB proton channel family protein [Victivallales bacterium]
MSFLQEILNSGAPISYVLAAFFALATFLFFHRFFYLHRINIDSDNFLLGIKNNLRNGKGQKTIEAIAICADTHSPIASVARSILSRNTRSEEAMRHAAEETAIMEIPRIQRNARLIAAIGQLAPLLGLLGTVISLMDIFRSLGGGKGETALSINDMSSGISTALITTAMGVAVALAIHLYNAILTERCHTIVFNMEKVATELINFLIEPEDLDDQMNRVLLADETFKGKAK